MSNEIIKKIIKMNNILFFSLRDMFIKKNNKKIKNNCIEKNHIARGVVKQDNDTDKTIDANHQILESCNSLDDLKKILLDYNGCKLKNNATNLVFSDGNPDASVLIIGEGPGEKEDLYGIPFCGKSGNLLTKMFSSIGLEREKDLYITNTVFWRPPANRKPLDDEIAACMPFVMKHISLLKNIKIIVLMGATAAYAILKMSEPIGVIRGKFFNYKNKYMNSDIPTIATFHPSYLLRQPSQKKLAWQDLLKIKEKLQLSDDIQD